MTVKGPAKSVYIVNDDDLRVNGGRWKLQSGKAIRVRGYTSDTLGSKKVYGGDALPVYVLGENDIRPNGGTWLLQDGEAIPVTSAIGSARGVIQGAAVPVYPVDDDGDYDSSFLETYSDKVLATQAGNLIGYWPLYEASGLVAADLSGNGFDGAYSSDVSTWPVGTGIGDGNTAPRFDGTNDFINIWSAGLAAAFDGSEGTVMTWCLIDAGVWIDGAGRFAVHLRRGSQDRVILQKAIANNTITYLYEAGNVVEGNNSVVGLLTWFHIAMTWSLSAGVNGETRYYLNGVEQLPFDDTLGAWVGALTNGRTNIGADNIVGPANPWSGGIAHVPVWSVPLTAAEILNLATV